MMAHSLLLFSPDRLPYFPSSLGSSCPYLGEKQPEPREGRKLGIFLRLRRVHVTASWKPACPGPRPRTGEKQIHRPPDQGGKGASFLPIIAEGEVKGQSL